MMNDMQPQRDNAREHNGQLVPAGQQPQDVPADMLSVSPEDWSRPTWSSLDRTTPEGSYMLARCLSGHDAMLESFIGKTITVEHVTATAFQREKDDGRIDWVPRTILLTPDGTRIASSSVPVWRTIAGIVSSGLRPPWRPPLVFAVSSKRTGQAGSCHLIDLIGRAEQPQPQEPTKPAKK